MGLIYLDSCLMIYLVERHPAWSGAVRAALEGEPEATFGVSPLVKLECLTGAMAAGDLPLEHAYEALFERLVTLGMPEPVYLDAARLRARFGLRTPDALHLACAQRHRCEALWTNDHRLATAAGGLARTLRPV